MPKILEKIVLLLLIVAGFFLITSKISTRLDNDFGWHLRFGKEASTGSYPYTDKSTYTHYGEKWTNHEWGIDIVFWKIYSTFGYLALVAFIGSLVWAAFLFSPLIFDQKITPVTVIISLLAAWSVNQITYARPASLAPFFVASVWYMARHLQQWRYYLLWPITFWLWSVVHGSWILGFVIILTYLGIEFVKNYIKLPIWKDEPVLPKKIIFYSLSSLIISAAVITINPYGWNIWFEIIKYFFVSADKKYISEWRPLLNFPVLIKPILFSILACFSLYFGWRKKWIRVGDVVLFAIIFVSGVKYVRQELYVVLISAPILGKKVNDTAGELIAKFRIPVLPKRILLTSVIVSSILFTVFFASKTDTAPDVWKNKKLQAYSGYPVAATDFLLTQPIQNRNVFNNFSWGGYLNWRLPSSTFVYFDGRGGSTWKHGKEMEIEHYMNILYGEDLSELENNGTDYIFLDKERNIIPYDLFNRWAFGNVIKVSRLPIAKALDKSEKWQVIYDDRMTTIWKKVAVSSKTK